MKKKAYNVEMYDTSGRLHTMKIESTTINGAKLKAANEAFGKIRCVYVFDENEKWKMEIEGWSKRNTRP